MLDSYYGRRHANCTLKGGKAVKQTSIHSSIDVIEPLKGYESGLFMRDGG